MLVFLIEIVVLIWHVAAGPFDGYSRVVPPGEVGAMYPQFYYNLGSFLPSTLTASITNANGNLSTTFHGSIPQSARPQLAALVPFGPEEYDLAVIECTNSSSPGTVIGNVLRGFQLSPTVAGFALVVGSVEVDDNTTALYNISCVVDRVTSWNQQSPRQRITSVLLSDQSTSFDSMSPFVDRQSGWWKGTATTMWDAFNFSLGMFPCISSPQSTSEFATLLRRAQENKAAVQVGQPFTSVVEFAVSMGITSTNCVTDGTCMPIGGLNVWATTGNTTWAYNERNGTFTKQTPNGSVAIIVSSTTPGLIHDDIPGADSSASGMVAALLAFDTIARMLVNGPSVYVFFLVGEEYGRMGSRRLIDEAVTFRCMNFSTDGSADCNFPYYRSLNFTTIDWSKFDHMIFVEQVGSSSEPLVGHTLLDAASTNQLRANTALSKLGINISPSGLPPTSLDSFVEYFSNAGAQSGPSFTVLSRFGASYSNPRLFSPFDTATNLSLDSVVETACKLNAFVALLVNQTLPSTVNITLARELWCVFTGASDCEGNYQRPNYYTSVFQYYSNIAPYQEHVFSVLRRTSDPSYAHSLSPVLRYVDGPVASFAFTNANGVAWVESNWEQLGARLGYVASDSGTSLLVLSVLLTAVTTVLAVRGA